MKVLHSVYTVYNCYQVNQSIIVDAIDTHTNPILIFVHLKQVRTFEGSLSPSSSGSVLEPVWELIPTLKPAPRPAPPKQSKRTCAVEDNLQCAAGADMISSWQAGVQLQPQIAQLLPGHSDHYSRPSPVIHPFSVMPSPLGASRAPFPPLSSSQPQPASHLVVELHTSPAPTASAPGVHPFQATAQRENRHQPPILQAPAPSTTAVAKAKPKLKTSEISRDPLGPDPLAEYERRVREMEERGHIMDLIPVMRKRELATLQIYLLDIRGLPAEVEQRRKIHDSETMKMGELEREKDANTLAEIKHELESYKRILAQVKEKVTADADAHLLQQDSEHTSQSCPSPASLQNPNESETSRSNPAKCTMRGNKERENIKNGAVARPLPNGWKHASKPSLSSKKSDPRVDCSVSKPSAPNSTLKNTGLSRRLSPRSIKKKLPPSKNTLAKDSRLSHRGHSRPGSVSSSHTITCTDCSSFQDRCTFPHKLISIPDLSLRDPLHEPPTTCVCATTLRAVAGRNVTHTPPTRVSSS